MGAGECGDRRVAAGVPAEPRLAAALQETGDVWVAAARVDGKVCLRPCIVNYRTSDEDVRALVALAREAGRALAASA